MLDLGQSGVSFLGGFTGILGFLVVFRSQQAYARWWDGGSLLFEISGEWINAFSSLLAFCNGSPEKAQDVDKFQHLLLRLMSLLHGNALCRVATLGEKVFEFIDLDGVDPEALTFMQESHDPCQIILLWVQRLVVEASSEDTIKVAPPILSRVYNQLGNGIVKVADAKKMTDYPIPFPLSQMTTIMLLIHLVGTILICSTSMGSLMWAGVLSFLVVLAFWSINYISVELEMPFGDDLNDLPLLDLHRDFNLSIISLMDKRAERTPHFEYKPLVHFHMHRKDMDMERLLCDQVHDLKPFVGGAEQTSEARVRQKSSGGSRKRAGKSRISMSQRCADTIGHHQGGGLHIKGGHLIQEIRASICHILSHEHLQNPLPTQDNDPMADRRDLRFTPNNVPHNLSAPTPGDQHDPAHSLIITPDTCPLQGQAPGPTSSALSTRDNMPGTGSCPSSAQAHLCL